MTYLDGCSAITLWPWSPLNILLVEKFTFCPLNVVDLFLNKLMPKDRPKPLQETIFLLWLKG